MIVKDEIIATYVRRHLIKELEDLHNKGVIILQDIDPIYFRVTEFAKPYLMEIALELKEHEAKVLKELLANE